MLKNELNVLADSEQQEAEARANDIFPLSARCSRVALSEDSIPRHLHARGSSTQDQPSRVTCSGILMFVSLIILVCHSHHPSLLHFSLQTQNLPFQKILSTLTLLLYPLNCLHDHETGPDLSRSSVYFFIYFLFFYIFVHSVWFTSDLSRQLSATWRIWLFVLHFKYTLSYRIVSCRIVSYFFAIQCRHLANHSKVMLFILVPFSRATSSWLLQTTNTK